MNVRSKIIRDISAHSQERSRTHTGPVSSFFGENTFNNRVMKQKLPGNVYTRLMKCIDGEAELTLEIANQVAHAMKEWAIEMNATHYCHWFQPLTGATAEKHDSFLSYENGEYIERFSGKQLVQQEPDASSFPSGGLRVTFEARGYTAWDPTSPAFIMESDRGRTLCIPSVFISFHGDSLDKKAPLLRALQLIEDRARDMLDLFDINPERVISTCGAEQEFFILDRDLALQRPDLVITGRTLLGAKPPKGQELDDQYFGTMRDRVLAYINDVEEEAYKLGIPLRTRHNEVAPHQYELAPLFEEANLATDHNQLLMEILKKKAYKHRLFLCLHEKPFARVNGSGKHLNWSLSADGHNLLEPGDDPEENLVFLTFLIASLRAVFKYGSLLRASVAFASNDHRLGGNEAPPAIISVFLGQKLTYILDMIEQGKVSKKKVDRNINLGIASIPKIPRDNTDRNRTSPFAFTGNKFEFRAPGSTQSIAIPLTIINTAVAESLDYLRAKILKKQKSGFKLFEAVVSTLQEVIPEIRPVLFEGDNYTDEWKEEAEKRGLDNLPSAPQALKMYRKKDNQKLFINNGILNKTELDARFHVEIEKYCKTLHIECQTLLELVRTKVFPAALKYSSAIAEASVLCPGRAMNGLNKAYKEDLEHLATELEALEKLCDRIATFSDDAKRAVFCAEKVLPAMESLRSVSDKLETRIEDDLWQLPKYYELLFYD